MHFFELLLIEMVFFFFFGTMSFDCFPGKHYVIFKNFINIFQYYQISTYFFSQKCFQKALPKGNSFSDLSCKVSLISRTSLISFLISLLIVYLSSGKILTHSSPEAAWQIAWEVVKTIILWQNKRMKNTHPICHRPASRLEITQRLSQILINTQTT